MWLRFLRHDHVIMGCVRQVVFIGRNLPKAELEAGLKRCVVDTMTKEDDS